MSAQLVPKAGEDGATTAGVLGHWYMGDGVEVEGLRKGDRCELSALEPVKGRLATASTGLIYGPPSREVCWLSRTDVE
jgi:hypothetical protein